MKEQAKRRRRLFRQPSIRTIFITIALLIPIVIILSYVDIPGSIAFVEHFSLLLNTSPTAGTQITTAALRGRPMVNKLHQEAAIRPYKCGWQHRERTA